jgi:hypothetical protein
MIYWVMRTGRYDMTQPDFSKRTGWQMHLLLMGKIGASLLTTTPGDEGDYAGLAILSADPGFAAVSDGVASPYEACFTRDYHYRCLLDSIKAWFDAPFRLRIQECEAAIRRAFGESLDPAAAATSSFEAPQASATRANTASPTSFYFIGGNREEAKVQEKPAEPTTAFPFGGPSASPRHRPRAPIWARSSSLSRRRRVVAILSYDKKYRQRIRHPDYQLRSLGQTTVAGRHTRRHLHRSPRRWTALETTMTSVWRS